MKLKMSSMISILQQKIPLIIKTRKPKGFQEEALMACGIAPINLDELIAQSLI